MEVFIVEKTQTPNRHVSELVFTISFILENRDNKSTKKSDKSKAKWICGKLQENMKEDEEMSKKWFSNIKSTEDK